MADGGPGFVSVLHAQLGGDLVAATVTGPTGEPVPATILVAGGTAWVESAQAVGIALVSPEARDAMTMTTRGLGELLMMAARLDVRRIMVGVGGTATNDGERACWPRSGRPQRAACSTQAPGVWQG